MRRLGILLLDGLLMFLIWMVFSVSDTQQPVAHSPLKTVPARHVTFAEVTEKSRDALTTTAVYLHQEKESLQGRMSITQHKLHQEISRLRTDANQTSHKGKIYLNRKIIELQAAQVRLLEMQNQVSQVTQSAWRTLKESYDWLELDVNAQLADSHPGMATIPLARTP